MSVTCDVVAAVWRRNWPSTTMSFSDEEVAGGSSDVLGATLELPGT